MQPRYSVGSRVSLSVEGEEVKARVVAVNPHPGKHHPIPWYRVAITSRAPWLPTTPGETFIVAEYELSAR